MFKVYAPIDKTVDDRIECIGAIQPLSLSLKKSAVSIGSFTMEVELSDLNKKLTQLDNIIEVVQNRAAGIIVSRTLDMDKKCIHVSGVELLGIFQWRYTCTPTDMCRQYNLFLWPISRYVDNMFHLNLDREHQSYDPDETWSRDVENNHIACEPFMMDRALDSFKEEDGTAPVMEVYDSGQYDAIMAITECEPLSDMVLRYSSLTKEYPFIFLETILAGHLPRRPHIIVGWKVPEDNGKYVIFDSMSMDKNRTYTESNEGRVDVQTSFGESWVYQKHEYNKYKDTWLFAGSIHDTTSSRGIFSRQVSEQSKISINDNINYDDSTVRQEGQTWGQWNDMYTDPNQKVFKAIQAQSKHAAINYCYQYAATEPWKKECLGKLKGPVSKYECTVSSTDVDLDFLEIVTVKDLELGVEKKCYVTEIEYVLVGEHIEKIYTLSEKDWVEQPIAHISKSHMYIPSPYDGGQFSPSEHYANSRYQRELTLKKADISSAHLISNERLHVTNARKLDLTLEISATGGTYRQIACYEVDAGNDVVLPEDHVITNAVASSNGTTKITYHYEFSDPGEHVIPIKAYIRSSVSSATTTFYISVDNVEAW